MASEITHEEMLQLATRLKESIEKVNNAYVVIDKIIHGSVDEVIEVDGIIVPSINKRVKDALSSAIVNGDIEIPSGKVIDDVYVDESGELIIEYRDV